MAAAVQTGDSALIENVSVAGLGTTEQAIEVLGANNRLLHVSCGTSGSSAPQVVVSGDHAYLEDVNVSRSSDAGIVVTGDRAQLVGITTRLMGFATGHGVRFNGSADSTLNGLASYQDGFGLLVLDSSRIQCRNVHVFDCARIGVIWDGSDNGIFEGTIAEADRHGLQITDSDRGRFSGQIVNAGRGTNNTYDGVFVDGDSDRNRTEFTVTYLGSGNQMRYGMNLSVSTINDHIEASLLNGAGSTGAFNDASTAVVLTDDHIV